MLKTNSTTSDNNGSTTSNLLEKIIEPVANITLSDLDFQENTEANNEYRPILKANGYLTRDPRMKERRKYGLKKARKAPQFSKR